MAWNRTRENICGYKMLKPLPELLFYSNLWTWIDEEKIGDVIAPWDLDVALNRPLGRAWLRMHWILTRICLSPEGNIWQSEAGKTIAFTRNKPRIVRQTILHHRLAMKIYNKMKALKQQEDNRIHLLPSPSLLSTSNYWSWGHRFDFHIFHLGLEDEAHSEMWSEFDNYLKNT